MPVSERVPFEDAINDPRLLKIHFATLSRQQQSVCKAFYGLPLVGKELEDWAVFQEAAKFDALGYPLDVASVPYQPKEYSKLIARLGRRSGKTGPITGTIVAYESALGGHHQYVQKKQDFQILFVAQDIAMAKSHLKFIAAALESSPLLSKYVSKSIDDGIYLKNGLAIVPAPPTIKSSRGLAIPVVVMDEVGFWYTDSKSANPDFEVEIAVKYAQLTFPHSKQIVTSTPWTKEGLLWRYAMVGTEGVKLRCEACHRTNRWRCPHKADAQKKYKGVLTIHAPTASMGNPTISRSALEDIQREDPDAFQRESMAEFTDSISGALSPALVGDAIDKGVTSREAYPRKNHPEDPRPYYIAAMDPAFRHDSFAFTIVHHDSKMGMVQDRFVLWEPQKGVPLSPSFVLDQVTTLLNEFNVRVVYSDQYSLDTIQQLCADRGFTVYGVNFSSQSKVRIYGSLEMLVKQRRLRLLDDPTQYTQLVQLEKHKTPNGVMQYGAPPGKHDDAATVIAIACHQAVWLLTSDVKPAFSVPTHVEEGLAQIARRQREQAGEED